MTDEPAAPSDARTEAERALTAWQSAESDDLESDAERLAAALRALLAERPAPTKPCNHGECAWQDECTLRPYCDAITTVAGDPWHGCGLLLGHDGNHDYSRRLYGAHPNLGITAEHNPERPTPTPGDREALAADVERILLTTYVSAFKYAGEFIAAGWHR